MKALCKPLMKKFLDAVPPYVAECVNVKRTNERLLWEDVLELIEDRVFDEFEKRYENEELHEEETHSANEKLL